MKFLFVHNNFPAQFRNVVEELVKDPANVVAAIGSETARSIDKVQLHRYMMPVFDVSATHPFARRFDVECRRAEQVLFAASELAASGFAPDTVVVHCGWGENLPLRAVFPKARIVTYCEFYYRSEGQDVHFEDESPRLGIDGVVTLHSKNASTLLALAEADLGISPTHWQRSTYPIEFQRKIEVAHEGVDVERLKPDPTARFVLPGGDVLHRGREIVTFAARNLEPMRGYHVFLRAVADILANRPDAQVVIVGGDGLSYGSAPPEGTSWKSFYINQTLPGLDMSRVHFLNPLPHDQYLKLLQVSTVHVYLTYPFVLSWSLIEAMAIGCTIVASDTAPVREAIENGKTGILVPFHDSGAIADAVVEALEDPASYEHLGPAARRHAVQHYDKRDCTHRTLDLIGAVPVKAGPNETQDQRRPVLALV